MSQIELLNTPRFYDRTPQPTNSPWGSVDYAEEIAPGIWAVSTASHGGIKLSPQRQRAMPDYMRRKGGWYEQDCDWALAAAVHQEAFITLRPWQKPDEESHYLAALRALKNWHPDEYERFFGVKLTPEESVVLRERAFDAAHADDYVVIAAWGDHTRFVPKGFVGVVATKGGKRRVGIEERWFLIPKAEYTSSFVIDLARHQEIPEPRIDDLEPKHKSA